MVDVFPSISPSLLELVVAAAFVSVAAGVGDGLEVSASLALVGFDSEVGAESLPPSPDVDPLLSPPR